MSATYHNFIRGEDAPPSTGALHEVRNPADVDDVLGLAPASGEADVRAAFAAASEAFPAWAGMVAPERGRILHRAANLLEADADAWAAALTREEGKTRAESRLEVARSVDILRYFAGEAWRVGGDVLPADTPHTLLYSTRVPLGVCTVITPWNFPLSIPVWKIAPALVMGNAVVFKPAEGTPLMALRLARLLHDAGLPPGVLNVVCGSGRQIGDALVLDPAVAAVSFTGSYTVGQAIYQKTARRITRTHLEMGGKNPLVVAADADVDRAVGTAVRGGFGLTGQACTATSRVIVEAPLVEEFTERLADAARRLVVGPGLQDGVQMGPAVSAEQRAKNLEYIEIARGEGAEVVWGGGVPDGAEQRGHFFQPTVLANVRPDMRVAQEEIFGPVIGIIPAGDLEEALAIANGVEYGLSASIMTGDVRKAMRFIERAEAGMIKINQPTIGAPVQAPFGGFKSSGSGMFREMGKGAVEFFSQIKTVWIDGQ